MVSPPCRMCGSSAVLRNDWKQSFLFLEPQTPPPPPPLPVPLCLCPSPSPSPHLSPPPSLSPLPPRHFSIKSLMTGRSSMACSQCKLLLSTCVAGRHATSYLMVCHLHSLRPSQAQSQAHKKKYTTCTGLRTVYGEVNRSPVSSSLPSKACASVST